MCRSNNLKFRIVGFYRAACAEIVQRTTLPHLHNGPLSHRTVCRESLKITNFRLKYLRN